MEIFMWLGVYPVGGITFCDKSLHSGAHSYSSSTFFFQMQTAHRITSPPYSIHLSKKFLFQVIQKSEVLNLRCINVRQYCKYFLKYWSKDIKSPLDPWGGQNFQCFIKSEGLLHLWGVYKRVQNIDFLNKIYLSTSIDPQRWSRPSYFIKHWKFWPP